MKNIITLVTIVSILFILGCKDKKDSNSLDFNNYSFNTIIKGEGFYNIGYEFIIENRTYINKNFNFIYYSKNLTERRLLIPGSLKNDEYPIYWREVNLPFKIIKKANSDTLLIIKDNKEFIFKRIKNEK